MCRGRHGWKGSASLGSNKLLSLPLLWSWLFTAYRVELAQTVWWVNYCLDTAGTEIFLRILSGQTASGAQLSSCSSCTWLLSLGVMRRGVKLTNHLRLVLSLRISGDIPLLHLYALIAWTGRTLPLHLTLLLPAQMYDASCCFDFWLGAGEKRFTGKQRTSYAAF